NGQSTTYGQNITGSNVIAKSKVDIELEKIKYCVPGTYMPADSNDCSDCGIGHYCTGGIHRAPCTGGAIACPGENHDVDELVVDSLMNRILTFSEVNAYIPATDISQWQKLSGCGTQMPGGEGAVNNIGAACAYGVIGPGTYMFVQRYPCSIYVPSGTVDPLTGECGHANIYLAVFDHAVGYRSVHVSGVYKNLVDVDHAPYQAYTMQIPAGAWTTNTNQTNVSNIIQEVPTTSLYVFELK
ncbi:MAG: hypothetical protein LBJ73_04745, partial [Rickettsiales bacterium]|nr:hypothetical protein [Rickettsiales bacterium]